MRTCLSPFLRLNHPAELDPLSSFVVSKSASIMGVFSRRRLQSSVASRLSSRSKVCLQRPPDFFYSLRNIGMRYNCESNAVLSSVLAGQWKSLYAICLLSIQPALHHSERSSMTDEQIRFRLFGVPAITCFHAFLEAASKTETDANKVPTRSILTTS